MENSVLLNKIQRFCAYQERCSSEVVKKLMTLGASQEQITILLNLLIESSFLNEERYAISYAESKFNLKKWGSIKIAMYLKQKGISKENINKAVGAISAKEINATLNSLYEKKWASLANETNLIKRKQKTLRYLLSKGYTYNQISTLLHLDD